MRQLTGIDNSFLSMETANQFGHVASLTTFDTKGTPTGAFLEAITKSIEERIHLMPFMRRRLVEVPFGLDHPYWIEDPDFDLDFHIRSLALPAPGTDEQLGEQVARLAARALDRARPLWELYVIEGLSGGRTGLLVKIHHATIDGAQGVELLATLLDPDPKGRKLDPPAEEWKPEEEPSPVEMMGRTFASWARNPERMYRLSAKAFAAMQASMSRGGEGGASLRGRSDAAHSDSPEQFPRLVGRAAPQTPFNKSITAHRRFAFCSVSLAEVKYVKDTFGVTINDAVMGMCASALRTYLDDQGQLPSDPLVAMVPVSVRTGKEAEAYSNQVAAVLSSLHTDVADPAARLGLIHQSMKAAKEMQQAIPADLLTDLANFAPPALAARASRLMTRTGVMNRINPPFNVVIANVPGPRQPLYIAGATLQHFYPVSTIVDGQGMNITVQSYLDRLDFGVIGCRELVPDVWKVTELLEAALVELLAAARQARGEAAPPAPVAPAASAKARKPRAKAKAKQD